MTAEPPTRDPLCVRAVTRRRFLAAVGAGAAVAATGPYALSLWGRAPALAAPAPSPGALGRSSAGRTLVVLEMGGGNDGLNMIVPHASSRYHDLRGDLAVADPIDLDGEIGLHPALGTVAERYRRGEVAVVEGIGYPDPDLSHFASMSTWWSAAPGSSAGTGWLGRYLDGTVGTDDPLAGVTIGPGPNPALLGDSSFVVAIQDVTGLTPTVPGWIDDPDELMAMWAGFAPPGPDDRSLLGTVQAAMSGTVAAAETLADVLRGILPGEDPGNGDGDGAATMMRPGRRQGLPQYLALAAGLVISPQPPRVIYIHGWGDFDTHETQAARHAQMMEDLDSGLGAFFDTVERAGHEDRVTVMTTSEFGRCAASNGSGTDHGTASSHLVLGSAVAGGRHGSAADLKRLDARGNLVHTVDFRSYFASVLGGWLHADPAGILGGEHESLGLFAPPMRSAAGPI